MSGARFALTAALLLALSGVDRALAEETEKTPPSEDRPRDGAGDDFDPWQGIDHSGRIPKVPLPPDIDHAERWRYIPEGRIKPGNVFQRLFVSSVIAPFIFRNGDVGTGFGVGLTDIDFRLQRRREFLGLFASYTTRGQQDYTVVWRRWLKTMDLPEGGVIQEERTFLRAKAGYRKTLTRRFFGYGPVSLETDESSYTDEVFLLGLGGATSLPGPFDDFVLDLDASGEFHQLADGTVEDRPSTRILYPEVFFTDEVTNIGMLGAGLRWDTRDSQRNPYRGSHLGVEVDSAFGQRSGSAGAVFTFRGGHVLPVPGLFHDGGDENEAHPPTDALAFGLSTQVTAGVMPFFWLPTLGGTFTQRGYIDGRWRDRAAWQGSTEYRFWVIPRGFPIARNIRIERVGLAAFYEVGAVADAWPGIFHARLAHSYGGGLRISLERAVLFRMDLGFSEEGLNFAAGFGVPF